MSRTRNIDLGIRDKNQTEEDLIKSGREIHDLDQNAPCGYSSPDAEDQFVMSRSMLLDTSLPHTRKERLQESEALYRTALETASDGITIVQNGIYVYVSQRLLDTIGRPDINLIGKQQGAFVYPDDWARLTESFRLRKKGDPIPTGYELRVIKPDQTLVYLYIKAVVVIYDGKPAILSFIRDITKQKEAEQALRESEELYRKAMESTSDGVTILQDGLYVYVNQKFLDTMDVTRDAIINRPLGVLAGSEPRRGFDEFLIRHPQATPLPDVHVTRVPKTDGSFIYLDSSSVDIIYQGKPAILTFIKNITDQKKAEQALRKSEERYRTIFESIDDDYFETDLAGVFTFLNKPVSWSGYLREELIGQRFIRFVSPEMAKKIGAAFKKIYRKDKSSRISDCEIIRKDKSIGYMEMSVSLMRDTGGKPVGFRGISRDISDRFKMEAERRKLTEQLYQAQKMEAIGTLAGGIAHDFNNLLMGIQGYASIIMLEVDSHHRQEHLTAIQTLVQSGTHLTRQLLGFARAGRYEVVTTNLNDLIGKSVGLFSRTKKEISIFEKYAEKIWAVETDRGQIEQVLLNMFVNAWQAMPAGGSLYLETTNVILDQLTAKLHDLQPGRYVKISITDTGVGMDEKTRQRIFDPFFTTKEMGRGTGLGLASAYGIIKGHGGMITVYSEKGQGTTFNIYLPASLKEVADEESADLDLPHGNETILLVDDEEVITEVTGKLLTELGYNIMTAHSGSEAIEIYDRKHADIHLVILDMIMPGLSGSDTFDRLKSVNPSIRTILSSGYSMNGKAKDIMNRGVRVFLQKPYRMHELARKIREALSD